MAEFIIVFREVLEASLVVGIIYLIIEKTNQTSHFAKLWYAVFISIFNSQNHCHQKQKYTILVASYVSASRVHLFIMPTYALETIESWYLLKKNDKAFSLEKYLLSFSSSEQVLVT